MMIYRSIQPDEYPLIAPLLEAFCKELNFSQETQDAVIKNVKAGTTKVIGAINGTVRGIGGYINMIDCRWGEFLYVLPESRGTMIAGRIFKLMEEGAEKKQIIVAPNRAEMYIKRGYEVTHFLLKKEQ